MRLSVVLYALATIGAAGWAGRSLKLAKLPPVVVAGHVHDEGAHAEYDSDSLLNPDKRQVENDLQRMLLDSFRDIPSFRLPWDSMHAADSLLVNDAVVTCVELSEHAGVLLGVPVREIVLPAGFDAHGAGSLQVRFLQPTEGLHLRIAFSCVRDVQKPKGLMVFLAYSFSLDEPVVQQAFSFTDTLVTMEYKDGVGVPMSKGAATRCVYVGPAKVLEGEGLVEPVRFASVGLSGAEPVLELWLEL